MNVLVICTAKDAQRNGASMVTHHHRTSPECLFWWPELSRAQLEDRRFDMVVVTMRLSAELWDWIAAYVLRNDTILVTGALLSEADQCALKSLDPLIRHASAR